MRANKAWRENAIHLSERYLTEGLHDRAVSRDLPNGVSVPVQGYEDKKVYVWIEAVSGYYSASQQWANDTIKVMKLFGMKKPYLTMSTEKTIFPSIQLFGRLFYQVLERMLFLHISFQMNI